MSEPLLKLAAKDRIREPQRRTSALVKGQIRVIQVQRPPAHGKDIQRYDKRRVARVFRSLENRARDVLVDRLRPVQLEPPDGGSPGGCRVLRRGDRFGRLGGECGQGVGETECSCRAGDSALAISVGNVRSA